MSYRALFATLAALLTGCAAGHSVGGDDAPADASPATIDAPAGGPDADPGSPDATVPDAPDAGPSGTAEVLALSEVVLAPTGAEMIEIVNPGAAAVDLSHYYLSDAPTYFRLPDGSQTLDSADFIARFPSGASIPGGGVVVVAISTAADFQTATGVAPTYSVADGTMTVVAASGTPTLTNAGELVALFYWDGAADLVTDVDLFNAGVPTAANRLTGKAGVAIDGPDGGATTSTYRAEAGTLPDQAAAPGSGLSTKRVALEAGHETQAGTGNGVDGHDETSEATADTWDQGSFTAPTPGTTTLPLP
ncbi:MAG: lamin tail domain-containing protein [Kofleriaceae bacterium]|nr:lamin tail domain-containing protein [Myxococcales bacterium]MCB9564010.1 lamin tail domain-containing protein [Kofleriaceae bacterium]